MIRSKSSGLKQFQRIGSLACRKLIARDRHLIPMKSRITVLVLATSFLAAAAIADNPPAPPAPNVNASVVPITDAPRLPSAEELYGVEATRGLATNQTALTDNRHSATHRASDGRNLLFSYQVLPDAIPLPGRTLDSRTIYAARPIRIDGDDPNLPTYWYPSVSLRFDFGRNRRS